MYFLRIVDEQDRFIGAWLNLLTHAYQTSQFTKHILEQRWGASYLQGTCDTPGRGLLSKNDMIVFPDEESCVAFLLTYG